MPSGHVSDFIRKANEESAVGNPGTLDARNHPTRPGYAIGRGGAGGGGGAGYITPTTYYSGDEIAFADDAKGESNWRGLKADRCHPLTALGCRLLAASNALFRTGRLFHAPDGTPPAKPFTSRHANIKPSCK